MLGSSRKNVPGEGQLKQKAVEIGAAKEDCAVITRSELEVLKSLVRGGSRDEERRRVNAEREKLQETAAEHKARMMRIDEERRSKGHVRPIEDIEREALRQDQIHASRTKQDEELDEVKHMNNVMQYAKCVTVRDAQIKEKKAISSEQSEEMRKLDIMMETERLKALRMYEEREAKRIEDRRKGAAVIRAQIEEREQDRLRKIEMKQQEQDAMLRHIDRMKEDDRLEAIKKKEAAKRLMSEVALANAEQIRLKNHQREMELEEDQLIAQYIKDKERRDQEVVDEQRRIKAEKEKEIARLRSQQERAQDKRAELDAVRARRAQEAYEREYRQREREMRERAEHINQDLAQARELQTYDKERRLMEQAELEKEEFERIIAVQREEAHSESATQEKLRIARQRHADQLRKQIEEIEENRRKDRRSFLDEGGKFKTEMREREALVEAIRQRKVGELEALGVPKQYRNELLKRRDTNGLRPIM